MAKLSTPVSVDPYTDYDIQRTEIVWRPAEDRLAVIDLKLTSSTGARGAEWRAYVKNGACRAHGGSLGEKTATVANGFTQIINALETPGNVKAKEDAVGAVLQAMGLLP